MAGRLSPFWAMAALLAVAASLRLYDLGGPSLTVDEGMSAFEAFLVPRDAAAIPGLMREIREVHPPGWFVGLHYWASLGTSEGWLRLSSALAGLLAVPLTVWLGDELRQGRREPGTLAAGLLLATSAWHGQYSRELRMYPLLGLLILIQLVAWLRYMRTGRLAWLGLSTVAGGAAPWIHYFGLFGPVLTGLWTVRHRRDRLLTWLLASAGSAALFAPWIPSLLGQFGAQDLGLRSRPGWLALPELLGRMSSADLLPTGAPVYLVLSMVPLGLLAVALRRGRGVDALLWLAAPPLVAWGVSQFTPLRVFEFKYFVWCAPFLALAEGEALDPPARWTRPVLTLVLVGNLAAWGLLLFHPAAANQDWRSVAAEIRRDAPPEAVVLVHPSMMAAPLLYYGVPPRRLTTLDLPTRENLQVLVGHGTVWLVTTPYHPLVLRAGLEAALDQVLRRERGRQRPAGEAWMPSAVTRVLRYRGEPRAKAEFWPRLAPMGRSRGLAAAAAPPPRRRSGTCESSSAAITGASPSSRTWSAS